MEALNFATLLTRATLTGVESYAIVDQLRARLDEEESRIVKAAATPRRLAGIARAIEDVSEPRAWPERCVSLTSSIDSTIAW